MAVLPILQLPEAADALSSISHLVKNNDASTAQLVKDLWDTLYDFKVGRALSAIQIGVPLQVCVMDMARWDSALGQKKGYRPRAMVNPIILQRSWRRSVRREGCLSIPETLVSLDAQPAIWRHSWIKVGYFTPFIHGEGSVRPQSIDLGGGKILHLQGKPLEIPGQYVEEVLYGVEAQAVQHEIDHFKGVLIPSVGLVRIGWRRSLATVQRVFRRKVMVKIS